MKAKDSFSLYSKNGAALVEIAGKLLGCKVEDRIDSIPSLSAALGVSTGTVSKCLSLLEKNGSIVLAKKGHLGSYVKQIDYPALWKIGNFGSLFCVMPLPYTRKYEALASAMSIYFASRHLPFQIAYMRGANVRKEGLHSGRYDLAVMSFLAAKRLRDEEGNIEIIGRFGKGSYLEKHVLISQKEPEKIRRIAVDPDSIDQAMLTDLYLKSQRRKPSVVQASYGQTIDLIARGEVDGAIWNYDYIVEHKVAMRTVDLVGIPEVDDASEAALVCSLDNRTRRFLLRENFDEKTVADFQRKCLANELAIQF
jgi:biotin operon repressor